MPREPYLETLLGELCDACRSVRIEDDFYTTVELVETGREIDVSPWAVTVQFLGDDSVPAELGDRRHQSLFGVTYILPRIPGDPSGDVLAIRANADLQAAIWKAFAAHPRVTLSTIEADTIESTDADSLVEGIYLEVGFRMNYRDGDYAAVLESDEE